MVLSFVLWHVLLLTHPSFHTEQPKGMLALNARRQYARRCDCCPCFRVPLRCMRKGEISGYGGRDKDAEADEEEEEEEEEEDASVSVSQVSAGKGVLPIHFSNLPLLLKRTGEGGAIDWALSRRTPNHRNPTLPLLTPVAYLP